MWIRCLAGPNAELASSTPGQPLLNSSVSHDPGRTGPSEAGTAQVQDKLTKPRSHTPAVAPKKRRRLSSASTVPAGHCQHDAVHGSECHMISPDAVDVSLSAPMAGGKQEVPNTDALKQSATGSHAGMSDPVGWEHEPDWLAAYVPTQYGPTQIDPTQPCYFEALLAPAKKIKTAAPVPCRRKQAEADPPLHGQAAAQQVSKTCSRDPSSKSAMHRCATTYLIARPEFDGLPVYNRTPSLQNNVSY